MKAIINATIHTMEGPAIERGYIVFDKGVIKKVGDMQEFEGIDGEVIDASGCHVTPGLIDAHCHVGMWEDSMDFEGADGNEDTDPITPHLRAVDGINPFDRSFADARRAGITTVVTGPGSANVVGGQFAALKTYGSCVDDMILKAPAAIKIALGENPKSTYHQKNQAPVTRMGAAAMLREVLFKAKNYRKALDEHQKDPHDNEKPEFDLKLHSLLPLLKREIPAKVHAHRADDIATALRIAKEFKIRVTIEHATEGHLIADVLKQQNVPLMVGPTLCERSKIELKNLSFQNYKKLYDAGLSVAIITDHPVVPIEYLPLCAALAVKNSLPPEAALAAITITAARNCGIADRVGSIRAGKDADLVIFDSPPLDFNAKVIHTFIDGVMVE